MKRVHKLFNWSSFIRPWRPVARVSSSRLASTWFSPAHQKIWIHRCQSTALAAQCPAMCQQKYIKPSAPLHQHLSLVREHMNTKFQNMSTRHERELKKRQLDKWWQCLGHAQHMRGRCNRMQQSRKIVVLWSASYVGPKIPKHSLKQTVTASHNWKLI